MISEGLTELVDIRWRLCAWILAVPGLGDGVLGRRQWRRHVLGEVKVLDWKLWKGMKVESFRGRS